MSAIDISYWQHYPDFAQVRSSDATLVILKCGGGEGGRLYQDSVYATNRAAARAHGLAVGSYFFNGPVDPVQAADFQMSIADWQSGDVVAIDVENNGSTAHWTVGQVYAWCARILAHGVPADRIAVYMSSSLLSAGWGSVVALGVKLWVAQYGPNDGAAHSVPGSGPWSSWSLWQFTSALGRPGIVGNVDTNQIASSWASDGSSPIVSTPTRKKKSSMTTMYFSKIPSPVPATHTQFAAGVIYAIGGDSAGTPANWLETQDLNLANGLAGFHSAATVQAAIWLEWDSYLEWRAKYLAPVATAGAAGTTNITADMTPLVAAITAQPDAIATAFFAAVKAKL